LFQLVIRPFLFGKHRLQLGVTLFHGVQFSEQRRRIVFAGLQLPLSRRSGIPP
jgi:hypothetical protein